MADQKFYVQDGKSVTANRKSFGAGAEVSSELGQERCKKFEKAGIVGTKKPASLVESEKRVAEAKARAEKREKQAAAAAKPAAKKTEKKAEKPAE